MPNVSRDRQPLVWLAEVPFEGIPHRQSHLARLLTAEFDVLFVEPPPPRRAARAGSVLRDGVRVAQAVPLLNARPLPLRMLLHMPAARRLAVRYAAAQLARAGTPATRPIVICSTVFLAEAAAALRPSLMVVDICDDPRHYPGEPPWTADLLLKSVRSADLVTTSSRWLLNEFRSLDARRVEHLPNGVSDQQLRYVSERQPHDPHVIGFIGYIGPWIDLELLERAAEALPHTRLLLAGSVDPSVTNTFSRLLARPNVRHLGFVPPESVPEVIASFDVCLMPFRIQEYTRAVNPIKLYEYAAQNLPIVSTAFSLDVEHFRDDIDVCSTADAFVDAVARRIQEGSARPTRWIAETHAWSSIATRLSQLIQETIRAGA